MITVDQFTKFLPEFRDSEKFDPDTILLWLQDGYNTFNARRLGDQLDKAVMFYAAHNLALSKIASEGDVGDTVGPVASEGAGPLSVSYDVGSMTTPGKGIYNGTQYGQRLMAVIRVAGAGGTYVSQPQRRFLR